MKKSNLYVALIHYPVYNKNGKVIVTCITGFDLHDIARSAYTYGIKKYYVVNPLKSQTEFAGRIIGCWKDKKSNKFNPTRVECFDIVELADSLESIVADIKAIDGKMPVVVATSAKGKGNIKFKDLKKLILSKKQSYLLLLGSGWGLKKEFLNDADYILEPIKGPKKYNHLSVRSAAAIIFDRLLSREE